MLGILNIDKPKGWSSFDVIRFLKRLFNEKKAGHLGTLDPLASGVLPVFLGKGTRLIPYFNESDKIYRAHIHLGIRTDTFDAEGKILEEIKCLEFSKKELESALDCFRGPHLQSVPAFSAVKIEGKRAYHLARQGKVLKMPKREVEFLDLELEEVQLPYLQLRIHCSKGTYIRSLAEDLGSKLKIGAHLSGLARLQCGKHFHLENTCSPVTLEKLDAESIPWIDPINLLDDWETLKVDDLMTRDIALGRKIVLNQKRVPPNLTERINSNITTPVNVKAVSSTNKLVAIGHFLWEDMNCHFQPSRVLVQE